ncbi:MAG TPA: hypothetical protein PKK00_09645 [Bacteroidales bacterium]|nr:hypothetical protein [Bacteroidales bacterium]HPS15884.1 hypothetical protein [Bacteroidales bacterium]
MKTTIYSFLIVCSCLFFSSCAKDTLSDAEKLAALKNVSYTFNNIGFNITLPANALNGKTFEELMTEDSATYANPANYGIDFIINMTADNTKENAEDAKFDGMTVNMVMDTIESYPVSTVASGFEVLKNTTQQVNAQGGINLETHRLTGLYIFKQVAAGADLATTLSTILNYNVGSLSGVINMPSVQQQIPTSASDEMKNFLNGLINSGVFD